MKVLVTRPPREAAQWADALRARGLHAVALPLIDIGPATDSEALQAARERLAQYRAVMFVSANAADYLLAPPMPLFPPRAWATGPGTCAALRRAGVSPAQIDAPAADAGQFDSEALWALVGPTVQPGDRVLLVRGADAQGHSAGRDWFGDRLRDAGAAVDVVVAYQRRAPMLDSAALAEARSATQDGTVWLFSSSEAISHLRMAMPGQSWAAARAVATHPRIAETARQAGFGVVRESRPTIDDVVASIESIA